MKKLLSPAGTECQVNDDSLEWALAHGFKEVKKAKTEEAPKKRGRKPKAE